jgi:hypothetical protein
MDAPQARKGEEDLRYVISTIGGQVRQFIGDTLDASSRAEALS